MAVWCLKYALESLEYVKTSAPERYHEIEGKIKFYEFTETKLWKDISGNMYLPFDEKLNVFVQHDGFLDKACSPWMTCAPRSAD